MILKIWVRGWRSLRFLYAKGGLNIEIQELVFNLQLKRALPTFIIKIKQLPRI
jgi:hypothetical protein